MIRNILFNTTPTVVHDNGYSSDAVQAFFEGLCIEALPRLKSSQSPVRDITFLTWRNYPVAGSFEQSLSSLGYSCTVLGQEIKRWSHIAKIELNRTALAKVDTEYVMACDAHDVIMLDDPSVVLDHFKSMPLCEMLFNAEKNHWPRGLPTKAFEESVAEKPFCYLNAGVWIARTAFAKALAEEAAVTMPPPGWDGGWDDQGVYKLLYQKHYPAIRIDDRCRVFQTLRDDSSVDWFLHHDPA
jgi:hypothetical protein